MTSEISEIKFYVPSVPVAQPRQRHTMGGRGMIRNYIPSDHPIHEFKACVKQSAAIAYDGPPLSGPLELNAVFIMPRPKRLVWKKRKMVRQMHTTKPDKDNLEKALKDALTAIIWRDDSQVCDGRIQKLVASGDEQPHVEVHIRQIPLIPNLGT